MRWLWEYRGIIKLICFKSGEKTPGEAPALAFPLYRRRNEVERLFRRLKGFRRIFSRFEKLDLMFRAFIHFALIFEALR
jgi:transposase